MHVLYVEPENGLKNVAMTVEGEKSDTRVYIDFH